MYGLVNQAVRQMVLDNYGEDAWEKMVEKTGCDDVFIGMEQYPDEVTVGLVGAACELLGAQPHDVLKAFGEYWIGFTGEAYNDLLEISGENFVEFIKNLNELHVRVGEMMPELAPPSFTVSDEQPGSFHLHYHSDREGLHPMIPGMIKGLGDRFSTEVEISRLRGAEDGLDHDEFLVKYTVKAA